MTAPRWMTEATQPTEAERAAVRAELPAELRAGLSAATAPTAAERQALLARRAMPRRTPAWRWAAVGAAALVLLAVALQPSGQRLGPSIVLSGERIATVTERADGFDVALRLGEVRAEVDPEGERRNLRVIAGDVVVSVKGTVFTVRRDPAAVTVAVERGRVEVAHGAAAFLLDAGDTWSSSDAPRLARRAPQASPPVPAPVPDTEPNEASAPSPTRGPAPPAALAPRPGPRAVASAAPRPTSPSPATPSAEDLAEPPAAESPPADSAPAAAAASPAPPLAAPIEPEPLAALVPEPTPAPPSGAEAWLGLLARLESEPPSDRLLADLEAWRSAHPGSPLADEAALARLELVAAVRPDLAAAELGAWLAAHPRHAAVPRVQTLRLRRLEADAGCAAAVPGWLELAESATGARRAEARARAGLCVLDEQPASGRRLLRLAQPDLEPALAGVVRDRLEAGR